MYWYSSYICGPQFLKNIYYAHFRDRNVKKEKDSAGCRPPFTEARNVFPSSKFEFLDLKEFNKCLSENITIYVHI